MNTSQWLRVTLLTFASFFTVGALSPTTASTFDSQEVDSSKFIAIAAPFGENKHQLLLIEQISDKQACWSESGSNPVSVEPLLLNFDFTGICDRKTDSNGYSLRMNGQDLGLDYILRLVERNGELVLVGSHRVDRTAPDIEIGRTRGHTDGFEKIFLDTGWRLTRRTYQGKKLGHIYLTSDSSAPATTPVTQQSSPSAQPQPQEPERELIFTSPQAEPTAPQSEPTAPAVEVPTTPPQTQPSPSTPERQIPVFVVPTK
jgi:N-acetylmuramoyl-L-alanine amidase